MSARRFEWWKTDAAFRVAICLFALVVAGFAFIAMANALIPGKSIKDYELWYETGQRMLEGEPIYPAKLSKKFPFMYPPSAAAMLAPISLLGRTGLVIALLAVNAAAWFASILLSARLAAGNWKRQHLFLYVIPSLIVVVYVWSNFHIGQPSIVLLALMLGAFVALRERWQALAGALFALAAAIKAFPFIAIVYLFYRRYWLAAISLVLALAFLLFALPAPFQGFSQARTDLQRWTKGMLLKYDEEGVAQRPGRSNSWKNQSVFGLANRTLRPVDADDQVQAHTPVYANIAELNFRVVNGIIVGLGLLLGLTYLAVMPRRAARTRQTDAIEFALFILLLLMFTPLAFGYLFVCLMFPFAVVVQRVMERQSRVLLGCSLMAVALLALSVPWQRPAQIYGNNFFATLLLFVGLALELRKEVLTSRRSAPQRAQPAQGE